MRLFGLDVSWRRPEARSITLADFPQALLNPPTAAGVAVTEATALNFSAYFNGVDIISSQVAALPRIPYRRLDGGARERVSGLPLSRVLDQPNPMMTDFVFWQTLVAHMLTWGNAYAEIEFDKALRPIALWPVTPDKITPTVVGNRVAYKYAGREQPIASEDILHFPGLGFDGLKGYSVVTMARQSIGLGVAAERYGGSFFGGGAWPGILLEHPKTLTKEAKERIEVGWARLHQGPDRAHATAILEEGMKANKLGIPPDDAQFLQTREFQVVEIARWLNLPVRKLKVGGGTAPTTPESGQIEFLTDTLRPWLVRIEQECGRKLIIPAQRSTYYVEHLVDAILRADSASRMQSYKALFDMGAIDAELIAEKENLPKPKPKPAPAAPVAPPAGSAPPPPPARMLAADRANLMDAAGRFVRREAIAARRASKKGPEAFSAWADEFYRDEVGMLRGFLVPAVRLSLACRGLEGDADGVSAALAKGYIERSKEDLLGLPVKDLEARADALVSRWETGRPAELVEQFLALQPEELRAKAAPPVVNVTVNVPAQPAPVVNVAAPEVRVDAPVTVSPTEVTVNVPQQAPPIVRAGDVTVNVPPQMPPDVNVTIPAPVVRVDAPVTVNVPSPAPLKVERDGNGVITGITPKKG